VSRLEAWFVHLANLLVGGTGIVYAWMRYFAKPADAFAVANHPWQPAVQHLHVVAAPLLVFAVGLLFRSHAWAGIRLGIRTRRRSGLLLLLGAAPMILSGYLLQTAADSGWRAAWLAIHLATSGLWLVATLVHQVSPRPAGGPRAGSASSPGS
jgi:hypothetical protein